MERTDTSTQEETDARGARPAGEAEDGKIDGIDTKALFETIDAVEREPAKASCKFFSTTRWEGGTVTATEIARYELGGTSIPQSYTIHADEPALLLGTDTAPNPQMLLYAALASCVMNTFVVNAAARKIRLRSLELDVEGTLDLRGFLGIDESVSAGYESLSLVCRVDGDGTLEQYHECLEAGTKYSPNFQTIAKSVPIHYRIDVH